MDFLRSSFMKVKKPVLFLLLFSVLIVPYTGYSEDGRCVSGDCLNGRGVKEYPNGAVYDGQWKNGMYHGFGKLISGGIYIGEFATGKYNGQGVLRDVYGGRYTGQFRNGEFNGHGTFESAYGEGRFVGNFKNDKKDGRGVEYSFTGEKRIGTWKDGHCYNIDLYNEKNVFVRKLYDNGSYVSSPPADTFVYGVTTEDSVIVYAGPDIKSRIIASMEKGEVLVLPGKSKKRVRIKGEEYQWINVLTTRKNKGWVLDKYIHEVTGDNSVENNVYRSLLRNPGFNLESAIKSGILSRCTISMGREDRVCVWNERLVWFDNSREGFDNRNFYTINSKGRLLSYDKYAIASGDYNYHMTKGAAVFWNESDLQIFDRAKFTKAENPERDYPSKKYESVLEHNIYSLYRGKGYDIKRSSLSFDPEPLTLLVFLYPQNQKEVLIKKYKFDERRFRLTEKP